MYILGRKASVDDEIKTRRQMAKAMRLGMGVYLPAKWDGWTNDTREARGGGCVLHAVHGEDTRTILVSLV